VRRCAVRGWAAVARSRGVHAQNPEYQAGENQESNDGRGNRVKGRERGVLSRCPRRSPFTAPSGVVPCTVFYPTPGDGQSPLASPASCCGLSAPAGTWCTAGAGADAVDDAGPGAGAAAAGPIPATAVPATKAIPARVLNRTAERGVRVAGIAGIRPTKSVPRPDGGARPGRASQRRLSPIIRSCAEWLLRAGSAPAGNLAGAAPDPETVLRPSGCSPGSCGGRPAGPRRRVDGTAC